MGEDWVQAKVVTLEEGKVGKREEQRDPKKGLEMVSAMGVAWVLLVVEEE